MKVTLIIIGSLTIIFFILQAISMYTTNDTETLKYEVLKNYEKFEVRKYEAASFSYVKVNANNYEESSEKGFKKLANYIFGSNESEEKIAMTSPVTMQISDTTTMMFMIPSEYDIENLPQPNDSQIKFKKEPSRIMAAIQFGGWANNDKIEEYTNKLKVALQEEGIEHTNTFYYLGYNPPYEIVNRRNEIVVEVNNH